MVTVTMAKGSCGGYLGPETSRGRVNVNKSPVCAARDTTSNDEVCSVLRYRGNTCNVTFPEGIATAMSFKENADDATVVSVDR